MLKHLTILSLAAALCCLISGCQSTPDIDLNGLGNAATTSAAGKNSGATDDQFVLGPDGGAAGDVKGKSDEIIGGGAWNDSGKALQMEAGIAGRLMNPERWTDCVVYFDYNQSEMPASERSKVDVLVNFMTQNPKTGVCIEGNTDDRGSDEYNRALGERRSLSVKSYMVNCGIAADRIITVSNGEDKPVIAGAVTEEDHKRNRRAEFVIGDLK